MVMAFKRNMVITVTVEKELFEIIAALKGTGLHRYSEGSVVGHMNVGSNNKVEYGSVVVSRGVY